MIFVVPDPAAPPGPPGPTGKTGLGDFGSIYSNGAAIAQVPGVAFAKLLCFSSNGLAQGGGVTPDAANNRLVINTTGDYALWIMVHPVAVAGGVLSIEARANGLSLPDIAGQHTVSASPLWGSARAKGSASLTAGDVIEVYGFTNTGNALTYRDAQLVAKRLS